jgi:hypothetical protein
MEVGGPGAVRSEPGPSAIQRPRARQQRRRGTRRRRARLLRQLERHDGGRPRVQGDAVSSKPRQEHADTSHLLPVATRHPCNFVHQAQSTTKRNRWAADSITGHYAIIGQSLAPHLRDAYLPWYARAAIYAGTLSGVEYAGCLLDREVLRACSWDYSQKDCTQSRGGCVDFKHAALWGMLGLLVEKM